MYGWTKAVKEAFLTMIKAVAMWTVEQALGE